MSQAEASHDVVEVNGLLAGTAKTIASVRYSWLVTHAETGGTHARPMGHILPNRSEDAWTIWFIADGRSRKASDIRTTRRAEIIFQHDAGDAYAVLSGPATLLEGPEVRRYWKRAYDAFVPDEESRAHALFAKVKVERMELWIRGVTPEPFGAKPTVLERDAGGSWRLCPNDPRPA
jgi:general stress protein 26